MRAEATVFIRSPVAKVFAFVAEVSNIPLWAFGVLEATAVGSAVPGLGMRYQVKSQLFGKPLERLFEITEFEENLQIAYRSIEGKVPTSGSYRFKEYDGGTELCHESISTPGDFYGADSPALRRVVKRHVEANLGNLRDLIETRHRRGLKRPNRRRQE